MMIAAHCRPWGPAVLALAIATGPAMADDDDRRRRSVELTGQHDTQQYVAAPRVTISATLGDDAVVAGGTVTITDTTGTDAIVAGGRARIERVRLTDLFVAAGDLRIASITADDAMVAGGRIDVGAVLGDDLFAAGGQVTVRPETRIGGDAAVIGGRVRLEGQIDGTARITARSVTVAGTIGGDVELLAGHISILPGADIGGVVRYASHHEADVSPAAKISGGVERRELGPDVSGGGRGAAFAVLAWLACVLTLIVAGAAIEALVPGVIAGTVAVARQRPWASVALGFAFAVAVPVAAALLFLAVVGALLGGAALVVYAMALILAGIAAAHWTGARLLRLALRQEPAAPGYRHRLAALALGFAVLMLIALIPYAGMIALALLLWVFLGALAQSVWQARPA